MVTILTIVVPVYNMEHFLRKCLDSLILPANLMKKYQVIVVNDGSNDGSLSVMSEYSERYPDTFLVIDKQNAGHGSCCNVGLKEATGKYIHFLDSDDWFDEKGFPEYLKRLEQCNSDVVFTKKVTEKVYEKKSYIHEFINMEYGKKYEVDKMDFSKYPDFMFSIHESTYKTEILRRDRTYFREKVSYDDTVFRFAGLHLMKNISLENVELYHYLIGRPGQSVDKKVSAKKFDQFIAVLKDLMNVYSLHKSEYSPNCKEYALSILNYYFNYDMRLRILDLPINMAKKTIYSMDEIFADTPAYKDITLSQLYATYKKYPFTLVYRYYSIRRKLGALKQDLIRKVL